MAQIGFEKHFNDAIQKLPRGEQRLVNDKVLMLLRSPNRSGLHIETINGSYKSSLKSCRVNDDLRIILSQDKYDNLLLLYVGHHEDAYLWANRRGFSVNPKTGEMQLFVVEMDEVPVAADKLPPKRQKPREDLPPPLFPDTYTDEQFARLGVPEAQLRAVRALRDEDALLRIGANMPGGAYDMLLRLYDGESLETLLKEVQAPTQEETEDLTAALGRNAFSQSQFVFVSTEDELNEVRKASLDKWRVFLHPSQRKLVERQANGPMKVLGGAGTGKTVVALHRVKHLLEKVFTRPGDRILLTTYTSNLAEDLKALLSLICPPEEMSRVEITNLDAWATHFTLNRQLSVRPLYDNVGRNRFMEAAMTKAGYVGRLTTPFFLREWEHVVLANAVTDRLSYMKVPRTGQGIRLSGKEKSKIWEVFEAYRQNLREKRYMEADEMMTYAAREIRNEAKPPFAAVVVDEAQDFSAPAIRLVAALSGNTAEHLVPNSVMIVGDAFQRIYGKKIALRKCGINVIGRSSKLKINYRTTDLIRRRAVSLLDNVKADDLDGGEDTNKGFRSLILGRKPEEKRFETFEKEVEAIAEKLKEWEAEDKRPASDFAVLLRTTALVDQMVKALGDRGIPCTKIKGEKTLRGEARDKIRVSTMHRSKGLEFSGIVVAELNSAYWPFHPVDFAEWDPISQKTQIDGERSLLYVAMTRAMNHVLLTGVGDAPKEL